MIDHVPVKTALDLFINDVFVQARVGGVDARIPVGKDIYHEVARIVLDAGLTFRCYDAELEKLWGDIRDNDVIVEWLINTTTRWCATAFPATQPQGDFRTGPYDQWLRHMAKACSACVSEKSVIDDSMIDQLPIEEELVALLDSNQWFLYLLTLSMSSHEILKTGIELGLKVYEERNG